MTVRDTDRSFHPRFHFAMIQYRLKILQKGKTRQTQVAVAAASGPARIGSNASSQWSQLRRLVVSKVSPGCAPSSMTCQ